MVKLYLNYFPHSKMAISEHKNGHFEEIRGWLQILELGSNSTIFHLLFDTYDSPGAVFIWKWEKYRPYLLVWRSVEIVASSARVAHRVVNHEPFRKLPVNRIIQCECNYL